MSLSDAVWSVVVVFGFVWGVGWTAGVGRLVLSCGLCGVVVWCGGDVGVYGCVGVGYVTVVGC